MTARTVRADGVPGLGGLDMAAGEVVLLAGPNGCGKTRLLRSLAGLNVEGRTWSAEVGGSDPSGWPAPELARQVAYIPHDPAAGLAGLTVAGDLRLRGQAVPEGLRALADRPVETLSRGEAVRATMAGADRAVRLLLIDEPGTSLDAEGRGLLRDLVRRRASAGAAVLAVEPSGVLDTVATRRVSWPAAPDAPALPTSAKPLAGWPPVLRCPAGTVRRDGRVVALPAVALGPGLHAVAGPNGSGKSTLLLRLAGLLGKESTVSGRPAVPGGSVRMAVDGAGRTLWRGSVEEELAGAESRVRDALVPQSLHPRHPLSLSAGEAQRVALAKAIGRPSPVLLLDEPEAALDPQARATLTGLLADAAAQGRTVLVATHDEPLLAAAHSVIRLEAPHAA